MGSNQNRFGDRKATNEWGSKDRKESSAHKSRALNEFAISDSAESNEIQHPEPCLGCGDIDCSDCFGAKNPHKKKRKKNTRRWCRGKEGREHNYVLIEERDAHWYKILERWQCSSCQKIKHRWK